MFVITGRFDFPPPGIRNTARNSIYKNTAQKKLSPMNICIGVVTMLLELLLLMIMSWSVLEAFRGIIADFKPQSVRGIGDEPERERKR